VVRRGGGMVVVTKKKNVELRTRRKSKWGVFSSGVRGKGYFHLTAGLFFWQEKPKC